ncbi:unnamed protein product [Chrysoparadoxa australica]
MGSKSTGSLTEVSGIACTRHDARQARLASFESKRIETMVRPPDQPDVAPWLSELWDKLTGPARCGFCRPRSDGAQMNRKRRATIPGHQHLLVVNDFKVSRDYLVGDVLGSGAFAEVRLGTHIHNGDKVALKIVKRAGRSQMDELLVLSEARVMSSLSHQGIVNMMAFHQTPESFVLVLELVTGGELYHAIVKRNHYTEGCTRTIAIQLLEALAYTHARNIIHRDIKPENLLLPKSENDTQVKIADWGLAKKVQPPEFMARELVGSPGYVAPEIITKMPYTSKVDTFSVGVVIYTLLSGHLPFDGASAKDILLATIKQKPTFDSAPWLAVSPDGIAFTMWLLSQDPAKRPTMAEALKHKWITSHSHTEMARRCLGPCCSDVLKNIKAFNARERLKGAVRTVMAANRLGSFLKEMPKIIEAND